MAINWKPAAKGAEAVRALNFFFRTWEDRAPMFVSAAFGDGTSDERPVDDADDAIAALKEILDGKALTRTTTAQFEYLTASEIPFDACVAIGGSTLRQLANEPKIGIDFTPPTPASKNDVEARVAAAFANADESLRDEIVEVVVFLVETANGRTL